MQPSLPPSLPPTLPTPWLPKEFPSFSPKLTITSCFPFFPFSLPSFLQTKICPPCKLDVPPPPSGSLAFPLSSPPAECSGVCSSEASPQPCLPLGCRILQFLPSVKPLAPMAVHLLCPLTVESPSSSPCVVHLPEFSPKFCLFALPVFEGIFLFTGQHLISEFPACRNSKDSRACGMDAGMDNLLESIQLGDVDSC